MRVAFRRPSSISLILAGVALLLVGSHASPAAPDNEEKVVFQDVAEHIWWSAPPGLIMGTCFEFRRQEGGAWLVRCGERRFLFDPESRTVEPADNATQEVWRRAWERAARWP